jgi:hypothetical protein
VEPTAWSGAIFRCARQFGGCRAEAETIRLATSSDRSNFCRPSQSAERMTQSASSEAAIPAALRQPMSESLASSGGVRSNPGSDARDTYADFPRRNREK